MQFAIQIIQVTEAEKKNSRGGVFKAVDVVYKREGKVEAKSFPDWANKEIYPVLQGLQKDATYTVTTEKVGDFWKWLAVTTGGDAPEAAASKDKSDTTVTSVASSPRGNTGGKVLGSNYETKEERAARQKLIVAQSSLSNAIEYAKAMEPKGSSCMVPNLLATAEQFYNWVFSVTTKDLSDIESDVPQ